MIDKVLFEALCESLKAEESLGFSTYNEKRLHMVLKRSISDDLTSHEKQVGRFVADVFDGERIWEIQTASLYPLVKKIEYYLENTDFSITVIKPLISSKRILRVDKESGEILRSRRSPKKAGEGELLSELYWLSDYLLNERLEVMALFIEADEFRYSDEAVRYRKSGKYDSELFPRRIIVQRRFCGAESFSYLLEGCPPEFSAKEFARIRGLRGRAVYSTLNLLCRLSLLKREKTESKSYIYSIVK